MAYAKKRQEMGEEKWAEYQHQRMLDKCKRYRQKHGPKPVSKARRNNKWRLIEYKGGKCERCGYNKPFSNAYDFHHVDPKTKSFAISARLTRSLDKLKKEADKCILVCRNCHAEIHDIEYQKQNTNAANSIDTLPKVIQVKQCVCIFCSKSFQSRNEKSFCSRSCYKFYRYKNKKIEIGKITENNSSPNSNCIKCNAPCWFGNNKSKTCEKCFAISRRKVERPSVEQLKSMVWESPTTKIAQKYNVSDKSIDKWCKSYGIIKPPRGYWTKKIIASLDTG